jgi:hypothetical protein
LSTAKKKRKTTTFVLLFVGELMLEIVWINFGDYFVEINESTWNRTR